MTSGKLCSDYRDEVNNSGQENEKKSRISNSKTTSKYFEYKTKITAKTLDNESRLHIEVVVPYKYV